MTVTRLATAAAALLLALSVSAPASAGGCGSQYRVGYGDTLARIAAKCGTSVYAIMQVNPYIRNPNLIRVGQVIALPQGGSYQGGGGGGYGYQPPRYQYNSYHGGMTGYRAYDVTYRSYQPRARYQAPSYRQPSYRQPSYRQPAYQAPSYGQPSYSYQGGHRGGHTVNYNDYRGYGSY